MSFDTWMQEFYPVRADECERSDAIEHSLLKWRGLRKENLAKHKCGATSDLVHSTAVGRAFEGTLRIGASTCALCVHHFSPRRSQHDCTTCPLYLSRGGFACDETTEEEEGDSEEAPWFAWTYHLNPEPMIRDLEAALKNES